MKKRLFSIVLSLCMVLALMPAAAYAETTIESGTIISEGTFTDDVINNGIINGGTFNSDVRNEVGGCIGGGKFNGDVINGPEGKIFNGTFDAMVVNNDGIIKGGTFNGTVNNQWGYIEGGTFYDTVDNQQGGIKGGTFYGGIVNHDRGTVTGPYHIVSFDLNGGIGSAPAQWFVGAVTAKALKPATDPTKDGYKFTGWYTDEKLTNEYDFDSIVSENITLYAGWDELITVNVPFTTTVELGGNMQPGETVFNMQVLASDGDKYSSGDVEIIAKPVTTNGARSYEGEITFTGTEAEIFNMFRYNGSVFVKQEDAAYPNWKIDDTVWCLFYRSVAELSEGEEETPPILIVPASFVPSDDGTGSNYEMDTEANPEQLMTFTNTYTKSEDSPAEPDGTTNGEADKDSKADTEDSAKTGDDTNLALWLALMLLAGAGITGTTIYTIRKRTNE